MSKVNTLLIEEPSTDDSVANYLRNTLYTYKGNIGLLRDDITNLLFNSVGIDDHQHISTALDNLLKELADWEGKLDALTRYMNSTFKHETG